MEYFHMGIFVMPGVCLIRKYGSIFFCNSVLLGGTVVWNTKCEDIHLYLWKRFFYFYEKPRLLETALAKRGFFILIKNRYRK